MNAKKKMVLDKRIEQFCQSSSELLTGIHERHSRGGQGKPKKKKKRKELLPVPELDNDHEAEALVEDLY